MHLPYLTIGRFCSKIQCVGAIDIKTKNLEKSAALESLEDEEGSKAKHSSTAIGDLSFRGEGTECLALGVVEHGDQGGDGEGDSSEDNGGRLARPLAEDRLSRGELSAESSDDGNHGKTGVDDLRGRAAECHEVGETGGGSDGGGGGSSRGGLGDGAVLNSGLPLQ